MRNREHNSARSLFSAAAALSLLLGLLPPAGARQAQTPPADAQDAEEVVRISANLVQTDVMVFDKQNKFVQGLRPEQFELVVDGKPQPISFFEMVKAGSKEEEEKIEAARGRSRTARAAAAARTLERGRVFIFFLDDLHIHPGNLQRTRDMLLRFIEEQVARGDSAVIFTATGQLGFLQQLTDDKAVLRLAVKRLVSRWVDPRETGEQNPITEFQAFAIERGNTAILDYFIDRLSKERLGGSAARSRGAGGIRPGRQAMESSQGGQPNATAAIERIVRARARSIIQQSLAATKNTLSSLENVIRASAVLPGRKVLFFVSDGFYADAGGSSTNEDMRRISAEAARSGTVLYSVDSHGLRTPTLAQPASERPTFDSANQLVAANAAELSAYQEPLHTLAADTGGRAILDTNDALPPLEKAVAETSVYYLLAWTPGGEPVRGGKFYRIEARIKGRPDLSVRVRSGYSTEPPAKEEAGRDKKKKDKEKDKKDEIEEGLMAALRSQYPRRALPTSVAAGFTDTPGTDPTLTVSVEVDPEALGVAGADAGGHAVLDVAGTVVNDEGKAVSEFEQNLVITQVQSGSGRRRVVYNHQAPLKPGLYQVRVAARERKTGNSGSASQWLDVPDVKKGGLALSSLFVGETADGSSQLAVCADRRFPRSSRLGFFLYVYNASRASSAPDVALQVQVFRDDQPVITRPLFKIETAGMADLSRLPYGEDLSLDSLPAGRYVLQVTAIDRAGKSSVSQTADFVVE